MKPSLMGSVSGSYQPSNKQRNGFLSTQTWAPHLVANSASGSFLVFHTTSSIVSGKIISISLPSLTNTVVRAIGGSELTVANQRLKNDAQRTRAS